jgi:hypothetical protein
LPALEKIEQHAVEKKSSQEELMNPEKERSLVCILIPASCLVFVISTLAMLFRFEPFFSGYYSFAWWSYIILVESFLCYRGGESLLFGNPWKFLVLLPLSTTVWLVFEALNFRLSDWHYVNIPSQTALRWIGYPVAYSTVLPGIFSTASLLKSLGVLKNSKTTPLSDPKKLYTPFLITGTLFLALPLIWPGYFFPLVWGAFIFLLEPMNHRAGASSLLREWERGSLREFYLLLLAGLVCGFFWELWNFRAGAKWIYTVPHVSGLKIFEMPLAGFLGFPAFAVECYTMTASFFLLISRIREKCAPGRALGLYAGIGFLMLLFGLIVFAGIDRLTVISFQDFNFFDFGVRR